MGLRGAVFLFLGLLSLGLIWGLGYFSISHLNDHFHNKVLNRAVLVGFGSLALAISAYVFFRHGRQMGVWFLIGQLVPLAAFLLFIFFTPLNAG